jgi:hypothetical protein
MTDAPRSNTPYRPAGLEPLLRIPVRTPRRYVVLLGILMVMLPVGALAPFATGGFGIDIRHPTQIVTLAGLVLLAALPFLIARASHAWRIAGGEGEIRLFADRLEVPPARGHEAHVFPLQLLSMHKQEQRVRVYAGFLPLASIHRGFLITFQAPSVTRSLWDRAFADLRDVDLLFREVDRVAHAGRAPAEGQAVPFQQIEELFQAFDGAKRPASSSPGTRTRTDAELDDQIDEELRRM